MKFLNKINLKINEDFYDRIKVKQNDTARYLLFNLLDNGVPFSLENKTVRVYGLKPDGTKVFNNLTIINAAKGLAELQLTTQMLVKPGCLKLELVIYEATDILSTTKFDIDIISCIRDDGAIESTNEFSALTLGLSKLDEWDKYFKETSGAIEEKYTERLNGIASSLEESKQEINQVKTEYAKKTEVSELTKDKATINYVDDSVARLSSGTPLFASSVSGMTDTTKNYVNTTDGYLYTYSGVAWIKTGVKYQEMGLSNKSVSLNHLDYIEYEDATIEPVEIIADKGLMVDKEYIRHDTGIASPNDGMCHTSYIEVKVGDVIKLSDDNPPSLVVFYDENKSFLGGINKTPVTSVVTPYEFTVNIPNTKYIIVNMNKSRISYDNYKVVIKGERVIVDKYSSPKQVVKVPNLNKDVIDMINNKNSMASTTYTDVKQLRKQIGSVLVKLQNEENVNILMLGDSIFNFQNSDTLTVEKQKGAPIGLGGENVARRLWKMLNYNVYNNDRTQIINENGNMQFRRFDHSDWTFSNGYCGTNSMESQDWATNRSDDTSNAWRNNPFNGSPATGDRELTPESTYNIPMVGTLKSNATASITIPSDAIGCRIVFGKNHQLHSTRNVKISVTGLDDVTIDPSVVGQTLNYYQDFTFPSGTQRTVTITNVGGDGVDTELWIWGTEYWTDNFVRVTNMGLASHSAELILSKFDKIPKENVDLVIVETPALNDTSTTTYKNALDKSKQLFSKLKELKVPILPIMVHRTSATTIKYDRRTNHVGDSGLVPINIKNYKAVLGSLELDYIDMWTKSIDLTGGDLIDNPTFPTNFLKDWGHLGSEGNKSYVEELQKVFLWNDI